MPLRTRSNACWPAVLALAALACGGPAVSTTMGPPTPPSGDDTPALRVRVDESTREVVVDMGPFHVPAATGPVGQPAADMSDAHDVSGPLMRFEWPVDGWMRGFQVRVTRADGTELPRDIVHHVIGVNFDRQQLVHPALERFFGIGKETQDVELPASIGVPMARGQRLAFYSALHNDTGKDLHGVFVRVVMDYTLHSDRAHVTDVLPVYFDTSFRDGGENTWDVPPGRSSRAWEFTVPVSGQLLAATAHLHDYGDHVRLEDAETGKVLVRLDGRRDSEGRMESVETHVFRKWLGLRSDPLRLEAGRTYRVVGVYDSPLPSAIADGAMAHIVGIFAPDDMSQWPAVDPKRVERDVATLPPSLPEGDAVTAPSSSGGHDH